MNQITLLQRLFILGAILCTAFIGTATAAESGDSYASSNFNFSHPYFQISGGVGQVFKDDNQINKNLIGLKYGIGWASTIINTEVSYRGISDGDIFSMQGLDILLKKNLTFWDNGGLFVGVGGTLYQNKVNDLPSDFDDSARGVTPYATLGGYYALTSSLDISLQYEAFFNVRIADTQLNQQNKRTIGMASISMIYHPWQSQDTVQTTSVPLPEPQVIPPKPIAPVVKPTEPITLVLAMEKGTKTSHNYGYDRYLLNNDQQFELTELAKKIVRLEDYTVEVTGYADSRPSHGAYNGSLAEKRAESAAQYLINQGVDSKKIIIDSKVIMIPENQFSSQKARRVEIVVNPPQPK